MPRLRALSIMVAHPPRARREGEHDTRNGDRHRQLTCGVDWAEAHHDVALIDVDGAVVARSRIDTGASGFNELLALIADHGGSAETRRSRWKPTRTCSWWPWLRPGSRCTRST